MNEDDPIVWNDLETGYNSQFANFIVYCPFNVAAADISEVAVNDVPFANIIASGTSYVVFNRNDVMNTLGNNWATAEMLKFTFKIGDNYYRAFIGKNGEQIDWN